MRTAAISVDESEQVTAERMLRMHGFVLDNLREGVSVSDESGVIVYTNAAEDRLFGYAAGELVGQHVTVQNAYSREENDQIVSDVIDQLQNRGVWEGEWQNIRKDRTRFSSYARITTFVTDGRKYWVCVQEDISESKRSNERKEFLDGVATVLQGSFAEQPTLVNFARYCLPFLGDYCSVDLLTANGEVRRVETAHRDPLKEPLVRNLWTRYPYDAADPVGAPKALYTGEPQFHPQILEGAIEALARDAEHLKLLRDMNPCSYICVPLTARGHTFGALSLVMSDSGRTYTEYDLATAVELARRAAVTIDNARLYAAEHEARQAADQARQRAEEANRMKSQFVATMSHELRTPLNAIAGHVQLLDMQLYGPLTGAQREALARVARAQHYLLGLINDVLNFARLEAGKVEYDLHPVLLQEVVGDIVPMVEPQFGAKKLDLAVVLPAASPASNEGMAGAVFAWADSDKLRQVLLNVLSNAAKFTPAGGRVTLRLSADAEAVIVAITDTGVGVPGDKLDAIFEPFVQLNATYNRHAEGTGLGLAISRDLARGMGGELTCSSREREGSTFTLTLRRATG